ncbi:MAG: hypothetical protein IKH19_01260 [Muribaculaceae bacterium]|nr:hypothetical protein [Muribaculaceae bacterium]
MKKKLFVIAAIAAMFMPSVWAGGLMTNTNYHIAFDRMMARGATTEIDAAFSNPAGLAWTHEGFQLSFNYQGPQQNRDINATFGSPLLPDTTHYYKGKATAPFVPALFAVYKHDRWAAWAMLGIVGSGGRVEYKDGMPMFDAMVSAAILQQSKGALTPKSYTIDSYMKGKQYIYGLQLGSTYRLNDHWAVSAGVRINYYDGYTRGHVKAVLKGVDQVLADLEVDTDQKGWGWNPIIGVDYHWDRLTLGAKYEFRSKLNIPCKTKTLKDAGGALAAYADGQKIRYDMPALLTVAAGYEFIPGKLRGALEYHFFDDKNAKMAGDRQKELTRGTNEVLGGIEWDINKSFTVSCGLQRTDYGLSDGYETNTSFACDSYTFGLGGAWNITPKLRINASYFWTWYSDYTKTVSASYPNAGGYYGTTMAGKEIYSRTNRVLGVGIDYKF